MRECDILIRMWEIITFSWDLLNHKKHKKRIYDGRTKEGKAFVKRILDRRNKKMLKGSKLDENV